MKQLPKANPKSKTQIQKAEYKKAHPIKQIVCEKCGLGFTTLYIGGDGKRYCAKHHV